MKRFRVYVWLAAFIFVANAWLSYVLPLWKTSDQLPIWQKGLTWIAVVSQLPSLPLSKIVAEFFDLSYPGWAIATSVISILIYFPLIHLFKPWHPRMRVRSISRKIISFSSSLRPCGSARKETQKSDIHRHARGSSVFLDPQAVAKLSSNNFDLPGASSAVSPAAAASQTLMGS